MDFISLFAGIGGFDLGFDRAGMHCVAQVEKDLFCQKVLAKHWPHVPRYGDIRDVGKNRKYQLPKADVICGGFPCQPHSLAGKRKGKEDDRDLWPEYFRIVEEYRPTWVVGENVLGIRTTILDQVLFDLESLEYSTITLDLPAAGFNAPHIRERIFIIAYSNSFTRNISISAKEKEEELHPSRACNAWFIANTNHNQILCHEFNNIENAYIARPNAWSSEPGVCGVAHGVPNRMDRLERLGNAVVPQVTEFIANAILQTMSAFNNSIQPLQLMTNGKRQ